MQTPELSIVIPCLNEAESLPYCLQKAFSFISENKIVGEVIVVDNASTDDSATIAGRNYLTGKSVSSNGLILPLGPYSPAGAYFVQ